MSRGGLLLDRLCRRSASFRPGRLQRPRRLHDDPRSRQKQGGLVRWARARCADSAGSGSGSLADKLDTGQKQPQRRDSTRPLMKRLRLHPSQARRKRRQRRGAGSRATVPIPANPRRNRAIGAFRASRLKTTPLPLFPNAEKYGKILSASGETVEYRSACLCTEEEQ